MGAVVEDGVVAEIGRTLDHDLLAIAQEVARKLARAMDLQDGTYIKTPLLFSSGSSVAVRISRGQDGLYTVSDMGLGFQEGRLTGADQHYTRAANETAAKSGIRSDGKTLWDHGISQEQLVAAVTVVANCTLEAWNLAEHRNRERKRQDAADQFYSRMFRAVKERRPLAEVDRNVSVPGNSTSSWDFDLSIKVHDDRSLFDFVSPAPPSVAFAVTKCSDVGRLPQPPTLVCMIENPKAFGRRLGWLLPVANVVEYPNASENRLMQLAHVA
jgi:hypothetical protein